MKEICAMRYKPYTLQQVGPTSARSALKSNFPQHDRSFGIFSHSSRITKHNCLCSSFQGDLCFNNLKLYLKDGKQYGKTGGKRPQHFCKSGTIWVRVK